MKLKPDWITYLHALRRREIELIFSRCPKLCFEKSLEIGAGDGFQSKLISYYTKSLVCTEYDQAKLTKRSNEKITYAICDAEGLIDSFPPESFDLIFSSNLIEHLDHPDKVFCNNATLLRDSGLIIHVMPGPAVKVSWLIFFYPNQLLLLLEAILSGRKGLARVANMASGDDAEMALMRGDLGNNPKKRGASWLAAQFWPAPHGAYASHWAEFQAFRPWRWRRLLEAAGFDVIATIPMPFSSGYGFGVAPLRWLLEKSGLHYGYAYVAQKKSHISPHGRYFTSVH